MTVLMYLLFYRSLSKHLSSNIVPHQLSILVAHLASLSARLLPCEDFSICPVVPLHSNIFVWNSLVRLDIGRLSLMRSYFDQKCRCTCRYCVLFLSSSIASDKMSASGAPNSRCLAAFAQYPYFNSCSLQQRLVTTQTHISTRCEVGNKDLPEPVFVMLRNILVGITTFSELQGM